MRFSIAALLIAMIVLADYWPVLHAQALALDDTEFVVANPLVTHPSWASVQRFFSEVGRPSTVQGYYLPISMTSLMLDWGLGGRPGHLDAFHRTGLLLHILNTLLLLWILHDLFGALIPASLAALLFGLHPLTVQSVAWIAERKALLAALFAF